MPFHHSVRNFQEVPVAENEIVWSQYTYTVVQLIVFL